MSAVGQVMTALSRPKEATKRVLTGLARDWAGVPRGPLGRVSAVLRPRGRAVLNIGERVPDGTTTHRILGEIWVWSEADARRMVEQAGFIDLSGH